MPTTDTAKTTNRWGRIPAWWLDHPDLDADGLAVLAALSTFADEHGVCWPSQTTLAGKLKRSRPTINRILQRLSELGLVTIEHRRGRDGARLSCRYRLRLVHDGDGTEPRPRPANVPTADRDDSVVDTPCPPPSQEHLQSEQIPDSPAGREPVRDVPRDWMPSSDDLAWATARFGTVDLAQHVEGFTLRCQAHGYRYRDVGAAWRAWLMQDAAAGKAPATATQPGGAAAPTGRPRENAAEQRVNAWMAAAARLQAGRPAFPPRP